MIKIDLFILIVTTMIVVGNCEPLSNRFRSGFGFRNSPRKFARQEIQVTTTPDTAPEETTPLKVDEPESTYLPAAPYPAAGYRPGRAFPLPNEVTTEIPTTTEQVEIESGPYPPSGWKPRGRAFDLPAENKKPEEAYGAPNNSYIPPSATESNNTDDSVAVDAVGDERGFYYIQLPNGFIQKVSYSTSLKNGEVDLKFQPVNNAPILPTRGLHVTPCLDKIVSFNLSDIGEGIREVTVKEWFIKVGDVVEQFDNLCEVQSDKASVTITSRYDGKIVKLHHEVDGTALVGKPLLDFDIEDEEGDESSSSSNTDSEIDTVKKSESEDTDQTESVNVHKKVLATPAVRRIAMEYKVDLSNVSATGKLGRILKGDVMEYLGHVPSGTNIPHPTLSASVQGKSIQPPADRVEVLKGVRKVMFKSMTESLKIPHFAYSDEVDMTKLMEFRDQLSDGAKERGVPKLTFMPFCIKAASLALTKYPILNSSFDLEKVSVIYKGAHNISVAMDTPMGLVVPNVKNCQSKTIIEIAKDLNVLMEKGKKGLLEPTDFSAGTFSLSNIGIIGGTYTHPCIMAPQVSIGAMGRTKALPRFGPSGEIVKAYIMSVSWCADHRVIDGVTMAGFSNLWKKYLENPALFLLNDDK